MKIKIGGLDYRVERVKDLQSEDGRPLDGQITYSQCLIQLDARLPPPMALQCLWHEMLHAILAQAGISEHNEQLVDVLAYGIVGALSTNGQKVLPTRT